MDLNKPKWTTLQGKKFRDARAGRGERAERRVERDVPPRLRLGASRVAGNADAGAVHVWCAWV